MVAGLADVMIAAGFEVRPVLRALFLSDEFWSVTARQGLVRSPVEYVVNVLQQVGLSATFMQVTWMVESMGQNLFSPPNVSGWRPNGYWLSTAAASMKHEFANAITWRLEQANRATPLEPITSLSVDAAVARVFDQLGVVAPSDRSRAVLTAWLVTQRATLYQGWAEGRQMLALALMLPEMQLA